MVGRRLVRRSPRDGRGAAIPLAEAPTLGRAVRRTTLLRLALGLALVALLLVDVQLARGLSTDPDPFAAPGRTTVICVDLSRSVVPSTWPRIASVFRDLVSVDAPIGLVFFSDTPYELLPPGSPARELRPFLRFFTPLPGTEGRPAFEARFPANPWSQTFAGTRISAGLRLARSMLLRERVRHGSILLISDLAAPPSDALGLAATLLRLRRESIPLRILSLSPIPQDRRFFERLVGRDAFVDRDVAADPDARQAAARRRATAPVGLLLVGCLLAVLLAGNEGWLSRLTVPRPGAAEESS